MACNQNDDGDSLVWFLLPPRSDRPYQLTEIFFVNVKVLLYVCLKGTTISDHGRILIELDTCHHPDQGKVREVVLEISTPYLMNELAVISE